MARTPIAYNEYTRTLTMCIDQEWKRRVDYSLFTNIEDLLGSMYREMNILNPVHLRRITLLKTSFKKGEKASELLKRLNEGAKVSDLRQLTPEGLLLHLFLDKCPEKYETKDIKDAVLDVLREHTKVNKSNMDSLMTLIKEKESDMLSCGGRHASRANSTTQERPCYICGASDHIKRECTQKCKHCQKPGHRHKDCYSLKNKTKDEEKSKARSKSRVKKPADNKEKPDNNYNRVDYESD